MVWCFGHNNYCQSGGFGTSSITTPAQVSNITGAKTGAAGKTHSLALKEDGTVVAWGDNTKNQFGVPHSEFHTTPIQSQTDVPPNLQA